MSAEATTPEIGSEWTHATEPGRFVVLAVTPDRHVVWTEKGDSLNYYAPLREFLAVFQLATPYTEQETTNG